MNKEKDDKRRRKLNSILEMNEQKDIDNDLKRMNLDIKLKKVKEQKELYLRMKTKRENIDDSMVSSYEQQVIKDKEFD